MNDTTLPPGLTERLLAMLTQDVLTVAGIVLIGMAWSIGWTEWRKPRIRGSSATARGRCRRIREEAFLAAMLPTAILIGVYIHTDLRTLVALQIVVAPLAGLMSPLAYDLWIDRLYPLLKGKRRR